MNNPAPDKNNHTYLVPWYRTTNCTLHDAARNGFAPRENLPPSFSPTKTVPKVATYYKILTHTISTEQVIRLVRYSHFFNSISFLSKPNACTHFTHNNLTAIQLDAMSARQIAGGYIYGRFSRPPLPPGQPMEHVEAHPFRSHLSPPPGRAGRGVTKNRGRR